MITIDQLLESVDLDFEPRWITQDKVGYVCIWENKPERCDDIYHVDAHNVGKVATCPKLKLAEFDGKDWTECIYELPRKTTGKIEKIDMPDTPIGSMADICLVINKIIKKQNELVDAANELKVATMSNSIWKTPDQKPDPDQQILFFAGKSNLLYLGFYYKMCDTFQDWKSDNVQKWCDIGNLIAQADKAERLLEIAERQNEILQNHFAMLGYCIGEEVMDMSDEIKQLTKGE